MSNPLVLACPAASFVLAPQPANDTARPRRPRKPSKPRAATPAARAPEERRFELRDTPRGVALVEVSGEPARGYVVQVVTAQVVTVRETVRESFVRDDEGEWAIVQHPPRVETTTRTVYGTVEVPCAKVAEVELACWRAMNRPHGVGAIGDLALAIARGDEGAVEPVTIRVLVREHAELDIGRPREAVRLVKHEGRWEVEGGDALLAAMARARASFDAARAARAALPATNATTEPAQGEAAPSEPTEVPDAAQASGEFVVTEAPAQVAVESVEPARKGRPVARPATLSGRSLGSDAAPLPLAGTGTAARKRSATSPAAAAVGRRPRKTVTPTTNGGQEGGAR